MNSETILTIVAIIVGPIVAVLITRYLDDRKAKRNRKYEILSALMRTRRSRLDPDHVSALNLLELEFHSNKKVRAAFRNYARHLNSSWPSGGDDLIRHQADGDDLFSDLLKGVASSLGFDFDKRELERLGYLPQGLGAQFDNTLANSQYLREVLEGKRSIPIVNFVQNDNVFPPPPHRQITDKSKIGESEKTDRILHQNERDT